MDADVPAHIITAPAQLITAPGLPYITVYGLVFVFFFYLQIYRFTDMFKGMQ